MPCTLSPREKLAQTIRELEIKNLMELESSSDREEDILLFVGKQVLYVMYRNSAPIPTAHLAQLVRASVLKAEVPGSIPGKQVLYVMYRNSAPIPTAHLAQLVRASVLKAEVPGSIPGLSKTYSAEALMQPSPSNFKQLTQTTHTAFGKLCDLLRGDSIFYNNSRHNKIALEIQVAVGLSHLRSNANEASIGKIQQTFGVVKWPSKQEMERVIPGNAYGRIPKLHWVC
ncbi:hypothetical protein BY996DRAFT_6559850 [Phakopsora pachyrhizi]|nr:hypothetical protein BY996DRAFT_6559850 [Phakopsora pachyrhizi]